MAEVIDGVGETPRAQGGQPLQPHGEDEEEGEANDKGQPAQEEDRNGTEDAVEEAIGTPYGETPRGTPTRRERTILEAASMSVSGRTSATIVLTGLLL